MRRLHDHFHHALHGSQAKQKSLFCALADRKCHRAMRRHHACFNHGHEWIPRQRTCHPICLDRFPHCFAQHFLHLLRFVTFFAFAKNEETLERNHQQCHEW